MTTHIRKTDRRPELPTAFWVGLVYGAAFAVLIYFTFITLWRICS